MYKYCKKLKEGELAEGENPYSVVRIAEVLNDDGSVQMTLDENLTHYLSKGHEEATEEEYLADNPLGETDEESSEAPAEEGTL